MPKVNHVLKPLSRLDYFSNLLGTGTGCHLHFEVRHFEGVRGLFHPEWGNIYRPGDWREDAVFRRDWSDPEAWMAQRDDLIEASAIASRIEDELRRIERDFRASWAVDTAFLQNMLIVAGLYNGPVLAADDSGRNTPFTPELREAFRSALEYAVREGIPYDVDDGERFSEFLWGIRTRLYDPDSGFDVWPFTGSEFILVTSSHAVLDDAIWASDALDRRLTAYGLPHRAAFRTSLSGFRAVAAGMYTREGCTRRREELVQARVIPSDSYCASVTRFDPNSWGD